MAEMRPEDVSDELVQAAVAALMTAPDINDTVAVIRVVFAAALPLYGQRMREQIARNLELTGDKCDQDAECHADERSPLLSAQSDALWAAARLIRFGKVES